MPLYDQSTNLAAQGRFAPGVNYRADIRKPTQPMPNFPEGKYQFNVDLDSIGKALAQMSRDQASVDETRFKLEYAKKEKAEAAAEKQLKIDTSNALAQEISDVTAQLDQGLINPLTASRMQKEIKDRYRAMGILDASQIASTANAEDGGASTFLEKRREQYGNWELGEKTKRLTDIHNKVPSSNNMSDAEALNLSYNIEQAGIKAAAAAISARNNSGTQELATLSNQTLLREGMDAALYQATSTISNAVTTTPNMTPTQVLQNASMNTFRYFKDELGASDEVAYAAMTSAMDKIKPITDIWNNGTKEEAEYVKNKLSIVQNTAKLNLWSQFPSQMTAAQEKNVMFPGIQYAGPESEKPGAIIAPSPTVQTTAQYAQQGNSFVSTQVPTSVTFANGVTLPLTEETAYISRHPEEYMLSIATGRVPVGQYLGRPVALGTATAAGYNSNINLSGERAASASAQDLRTAAANGKSFYGNINTAAGQNFLKKQGEYDGVSDYNKIVEPYNTSEGLDIRANDPEHWNQVYFEHGRPIQDSNYLYNFLRIAPDGSLQMAPITGKINKIADALAADEYKEHIRAINIETSGYEPKDRASLIRSLVNKPGQGVPTADPKTDMILYSDSTLTEKAVRGAEEGFKWVNKNVVNKYAIPAEEKAYNWMKEKAEDVIDWAEKQGYNVGATYSNWLEENSREDNWTSRKDFLLQASAKYVRDLEDKLQENRARSEVNAMLDTITLDNLNTTVINSDGTVISSQASLSDTEYQNPPMSYRPDARKGMSYRTDTRDDLNTFQNSLEKIKNPQTDEEKAVKQNLQNSVEIGKQIENISDAALAGVEGMAEEIKNLGISPEIAAIAVTNIEDEAARDMWLEEYNRLGEMTYPDIRQMIFIGASITPAIFALGGKGAVKVSDYIDDFVAYLRNKSGQHLETNKEKRQREGLEREEKIKEALRKNQELFYNRYSTWRRFFTTGLYDDSGFETLDLETVK